jgi:two-component system chemotaxis sensor kinase CheA
VDEILGIEEIVVKPMPQFLRQMNFYSGCSILGDGSVALILDLLEIAKNLSVLIDKSTMEQLSISQVSTDISRTGKVPLLIFSNGADEQFAVPISLIERIEKFSTSRIQAIGQMEFTEHQGKSMRILRLEEYLNIQKPASRNSAEPSIIVIKDMEPLTCLFIHRIIDSKAVEIAIEKETLRSPGIAGSILIDHKITILLDIPGFIQTALKGAEVA